MLFQGTTTCHKTDPLETHYFLAHLYMSQHRFAAALKQAEQCQTEPASPLGLSVLGACLAHLNQREEALKVVATLSRKAEAGYVRHAFAQVHIALGNMDQAIESLAKSLDEREPFPHFSNSTPNSIRSEASRGSGELTSRLGL
jgi:tetratricopeptide (TPR) repeat protein